MAKKNVKAKRAVKNFYSFENYKPNKNAKPVVYKGTQYLSKAQCVALEGITRKELDEYLKNQDYDAPEPILANEVIEDAKVEEADELLDLEIDDINDGL